MSSKRQSDHILISSTISSLISSILANPIDIVKIRQQKIQETKKCFNCPPKPQKTHNFSLIKSYNSFKFFSSYVPSCGVCFPQKSILKALNHIIKYEGAKTLFNGARYTAMISGFSTVTMFFFYEQAKSFVLNSVTSNMLLAPFLASLTARTLATSLSFPLDYWKTIQNSTKGYTKKKNFELGNRIFSAYSVTLNRDILFSVVYWSLVENIRKTLEVFYGDHVFMTNFIAGSIAGGVAGVISLPLDVVKTRKQLYPEHANISTFNYLLKLYIDGDQKQLLAGLKPRVVKTMTHCGLLLTGYEVLMKKCQEKKIKLF